MRSLNNATCASGEPVSLGCTLKRPKTADLDSRVSGIRHSPRFSLFCSKARLASCAGFVKGKQQHRRHGFVPSKFGTTGPESDSVPRFVLVLCSELLLSRP